MRSQAQTPAKLVGSKWQSIRENFSLMPGLTNLNNGVSPALNVCVNKYHEMMQFSAAFPMKNEPEMWGMTSGTRNKLASLMGTKPENLALVRSTTEAMQTVVSGLDMTAADEIILSNYEYPSLVEAVEYKKARFGVSINMLNFSFLTSDDEIVATIQRSLSSKTKLLAISHVSYKTGRILPVKEICAVAAAAGVEVLVDGAHAIAQFQFNVEDLGCDYYAGSLHKWLCGPMGSGVLFVKENRAEKLWPLFGQTDLADKTAKKFEADYTYAMAAHVATEPALDFHFQMGAESREKQLRSIKNQVLAVVSQFSEVEIITPANEQKSCAMFAALFKNHDAIELYKTLLEKYKIAVGGHRNPEGVSLRFAPNIYTSNEDIELLSKALKELLKA